MLKDTSVSVQILRPSGGQAQAKGLPNSKACLGESGPSNLLIMRTIELQDAAEGLASSD